MVDKRLVYIDFNTEDDEGGARLMAHPEDTLLELTTDRRLIDASVNADIDAQGIIFAQLGPDGHWHLDHRLTADEIREHNI